MNVSKDYLSTLCAEVLVELIVGLIMAFPLAWAWNAFMPYMFGLKILTWGKAWFLYFLVSILFHPLNSRKKI